MTRSKTPWSWVGLPESSKPSASGPGRYSRPLAVRDQVIAEAFGTEVRRLRLKAGMSTRDLAVKVGLSQPWIVYLETKPRANIELRMMWDFAEALDVDVEHLVLVCRGAVAYGQLRHVARKKMDL